MDWLALAYYSVIAAWAVWFVLRPMIMITFNLEGPERRMRRYRRERAQEGAGVGLLERWRSVQDIEAAREIIKSATDMQPNTVMIDLRLTEIGASFLRGRQWWEAERIMPIVPLTHTIPARAPEDLPDEPGRVEVRPSDFRITTALELPTEYERVDSEVARRVAAQIAEETERSIRTYVQGLPRVSGTFLGRWDDVQPPKQSELKTATLRERRRAIELEEGNDE